MNRTVKNILKILLIGLATTIVRIIGQLSIPAGEQTVLAPAFLHKMAPCRWLLLSMGFSLIP